MKMHVLFFSALPVLILGGCATERVTPTSSPTARTAAQTVTVETQTAPTTPQPPYTLLQCLDLALRSILA